MQTAFDPTTAPAVETNVSIAPNADVPQTQGIFGQMAGYDHENLFLCHDAASGLRAIIAIHNTVLGPALGGTRMWTYAHDSDAVTDALRLSEGMTYKAAISGLNLGGGKAVIIGDPRKNKSEALFRRYGRFVNNLGGKYITAEDVGTNARDMEWISNETKHVTGLPEWKGGSGDPSPVTAYGVYLGMKAAAHKAYGSDSLEGKRVLVQGAGNVGRNLINFLRKEGAVVLVSDIFEDQINRVQEEHHVEVISPEEVYSIEMDIYAPCALGATLNEKTIAQLTCDIVAGAANNQLEDVNRDAERLAERGIIYAPDFLINAGGLINVYREIVGYSHEFAMNKAEEIYQRTLMILQSAEDKNISTHQAAVEAAKERIQAIRFAHSGR